MKVGVPAALLVLALATAPVAADQPRQPPKFKPFNGVSAERFYQSAVARRADQLTSDLAAMKAALGAAQLAPPARDALAARTDRAAAASSALAKLARHTADRGQLNRSLGGVEAEVKELAAHAARHPATGPAVARVGYDVQQLAAAVTDGDTDPARSKGSVVRLAGALDEHANDLWDLAEQHLGQGFTRGANQAVRGFTRATQKLHRGLEDSGDVAAAGAAFPRLGQAWAAAAGQLEQVPNLPAAVRDQVDRVDALYRRLGERVATIAPPGPGPAPAPVGGFPSIRLRPPGAVSVAVGAGDGGSPRVQVFHHLKGPPAFDIFAYEPDFRGGVRVAVADLTGDGVADLVTVPGKGMPAVVRVFDGRDMSLLTEFIGADPEWTGGVNVAATDLAADGRALVAVAPDVGGGPLVRVFDLAQGKEATRFLAFPEHLRGGARLAWTDANGDHAPDLVAAPGPCELGPVVRVFNLADQKVLAEFTAFDPNWRGGVWVAAGPGGRVVCGLDAGGPPVVRVFSPGRNRKPAEWPAFPEGYRGGVRVATADLDGDGTPDVICAPGGGLRDTPVRALGGKDGREMAGLPAFPGFEGGAFVAAR